ncbi:MAG: hypothetical protein C4522_07770 [Desulfobacteraceae bacterium]|nr:MAG: hypothetical protein C4522_07770 [Desulfobacteraceae bacterium]
MHNKTQWIIDKNVNWANIFDGNSEEIPNGDASQSGLNNNISLFCFFKPLFQKQAHAPDIEKQ